MNRVYRHLFFRAFPSTTWYTWHYNNINFKLLELPQRFTFWIIVSFYKIPRVFVFYTMKVSVSSRKLNGHQAFESMSLLGGLVFLLKEHFKIVNWVWLFKIIPTKIALISSILEL